MNGELITLNGEAPQDRAWADTHEVAQRMSLRYGVRVRAVWRRQRGLMIEQGLAVDTLQLFEVVRRRRLFSRHWEQVNPVPEAASKVGDMIRRADL